jgi:hypothetical protein
MNALLRRRWLWLALLLAAIFLGWLGRSDEPAHGGKRLSRWLDELVLLHPTAQVDPRTPQVRAVRAIGANAIPWLLQEMRPTGDTWKARANRLLNRQRVISFRFSAPHHLHRAMVGFRALGALGEPAIPGILARAPRYPDFAPQMLAGIGRPALPALQNCLTNASLWTNSGGPRGLLAITAISTAFDAGKIGSLDYSDLVVLVPSIRAWAAQSTNQMAQRNAVFVLGQLGLHETPPAP